MQARFKKKGGNVMNEEKSVPNEKNSAEILEDVELLDIFKDLLEAFKSAEKEIIENVKYLKEGYAIVIPSMGLAANFSKAITH